MCFAKKKLIASLLIFGVYFALEGCSATSDTKKKVEGYILTGRVLRQRVYCGGARPSKEMLDQLSRLVPYPDKTFYIKKGKTNKANAEVVARFTTDAEGLFSIKLPRGIYSILLEEQLQVIDTKKHTTTNQKIDEDCLAEWWRTPYHILDVQGSFIPPLNFIFTNRCFLNTDIPCVTYTGHRPH